MISWRGTGAVLGVMVLAASAVAAEESVGERVGKRVDRAIDRLREEAKDVESRVVEGFEKARAAVDRMGVAARVYARVHWDKALTASSISVDVEKDGVATLRGSVASEAAKAKAAELTRDTVGVERVVNELRVEAAPR